MEQELDTLDFLAFKFFRLFAQYESTLKKKGYFKTNRDKIIVDWDRYVNQKIGRDFLKSLGENSASAEYILANPPMKQVVDENDKIVWKEVLNEEESVQILFGHISRVRNNLFHGAKFNGTWFDPDRSELLLGHSLIVLESFQSSLGIKD